MCVCELNNGLFLNMFKMVQMMRWRYCSKFYVIGDYNTIGIYVMLSCLIDMGESLHKEGARYFHVEFLDVRACGDHFLKCILMFFNGIT